MFPIGSRANPFPAKSRSSITHRHDLRISQMLEFRDWAIKHHDLNLIVEINTEARERRIGYETQDHGFTDQHSVDESVAKILEQYCHA
jgi:hypothetical protein